MENISKLFDNLNKYVDRILSDAILFNQIPSPTEEEEERKDFIKNRLTEFGIPKINEDDNGNIFINFAPISPTGDTILVFTNIDLPEISEIENFVKLKKNRAYGRGIGDNSLGVATLLILSEFFHVFNLHFEKNVTFLFTSKSGYRHSFEGIKAFTETFDGNIIMALNIKGLGLGNIGYKAIGHYNFLISSRTEGGEIFDGVTGISAITILSQLASRLLNIGWPEDYGTVLNISKLRAGTGDPKIASEGYMQLEVYSKDEGYLEFSKNIVVSTINKLANEYNTKVTSKILSYIPPAKLSENSFIISQIEEIHDFLGIKSKYTNITDEGAVMLRAGIPTVSLGVSTGEKTLKEEYIEVKPIELGLKQIFLTIIKSLNYFSEDKVEDIDLENEF